MNETRFPEQKAHFEKLQANEITQSKLIKTCEKEGIHFTPKSVWRWYNGICQISKSNAEKVIAALNLDCTAAWLRGESEFMNPETEAVAYMGMMRREEDAFTLLLHALSALSSYDLTGITSLVPGDKSFSSDEAAKLEHVLAVTADGQERRISGEALETIRIEASDYIDYLLTRAIEREERR